RSPSEGLKTDLLRRPGPARRGCSRQVTTVPLMPPSRPAVRLPAPFPPNDLSRPVHRARDCRGQSFSLAARGEANLSQPGLTAGTRNTSGQKILSTSLHLLFSMPFPSLPRTSAGHFSFRLFAARRLGII